MEKNCGVTLFKTVINMKSYTPFKTEDPENYTLTGGMSLYRKYMGVPTPQPPTPRGPKWQHRRLVIGSQHCVYWLPKEFYTLLSESCFPQLAEVLIAT